MDDSALRLHLQNALAWPDAHGTFEDAIEGVPAALRGNVPAGAPHSLWHLLEHLRRVQWDILDFCRNAKYQEPAHNWYWPSSAEPKDGAEWDASIALYRRDRDGMKALAEDRSVDLFSKIPHGSGQTYLREILLVVDHTSYPWVNSFLCEGFWEHGRARGLATPRVLRGLSSWTSFPDVTGCVWVTTVCCGAGGGGGAGQCALRASFSNLEWIQRRAKHGLHGFHGSGSARIRSGRRP